MSEGTNSWCQGITNGCFAGGTCYDGGGGGGGGCDMPPDFVPCEQGVLTLPFASEWKLASVEITVAKTPVQQLAACKHLHAEKALRVAQ